MVTTATTWCMTRSVTDVDRKNIYLLHDKVNDCLSLRLFLFFKQTAIPSFWNQFLAHLFSV